MNQPQHRTQNANRRGIATRGFKDFGPNCVLLEMMHNFGFQGVAGDRSVHAVDNEAHRPLEELVFEGR